MIEIAKSENILNNENRIAKIAMSQVFLETILLAQFREDIQNVKSDAPEDLKIIKIEQSLNDRLAKIFWIYFTSKDNKEISEDEDIPIYKKGINFSVNYEVE